MFSQHNLVDRRLVQRVQRDPVPQRDDLLHAAAAGARAPAALTTAWRCSASSGSGSKESLRLPAARASLRAAGRAGREALPAGRVMALTSSSSSAHRSAACNAIADAARGAARGRFRVPVVVVQHRGTGVATATLADALAARTPRCRSSRPRTRRRSRRPRVPGAGRLPPARRGAAARSRSRPRRRCARRGRRSTCCSSRPPTPTASGWSA